MDVGEGFHLNEISTVFYGSVDHAEPLPIYPHAGRWVVDDGYTLQGAES